MTDTANLPATQPAGGELSETGQMLNLISSALHDSAVDVTKLRALLDIQEGILAKEARKAFVRAVAMVQKDLPRVAKNGTIDLGGKGSIPFARWEDVDAVIRPRMDAAGLTLSFDMTAKEGGGAVVSAELMHVDGHSKTISIPLALDTGPGRNNLQSMGSTLSYGKRYCAEMLFNIVRAGVDDDGKRGGTVYLSEAQVEELAALIRETKTETGRFLQTMTPDCRSLEEIETKDFPRLKNALMTKKNKMETAP